MSAFGHVLIVGAGVYGASTALELARLGHEVTVVDRSFDGFAASNAASYDLNKIIRADYEDDHYRDLSKKLFIFGALILYLRHSSRKSVFFSIQEHKLSSLCLGFEWEWKMP